MKGWHVRSIRLNPGRSWTASRSTNWRTFKPVLSSRPLSSTHGSSPSETVFEYRPSESFTKSIFRKVKRPTEIDEWVALLDGALPAHLRLSDASPPVTLDAVGLAEALLAAQYPNDSFFHSRGIDLLFHLGFNQGRWSAVVWLVKCLVERFPIRETKSDRISDVVRLWPGEAPLATATEKPIHLDSTPESQPPVRSSLDDLTFGPLKASQRKALIQHNALGQIWRSLGAMTQACAGGDIRSEVLELIAYIHHHGFMPEAIYRYDAHPSKYVVQQPPLLPLLSSRILTSLSDAAWRAHEKGVIEEAKAKGHDDPSLPPELPGSVYRVNIAGLRPEVWMELILWSSLYGGWLFHGVAILRALVSDQSKPIWKPLSWREYESRLALPIESTTADWETLDYIFKTEDVSTRVDKTGPPLEINRTVSAEVVNAYIDALVNSVSIGVGRRGLPVELITSQLHQLRAFLGRSHLTISNGTWDALIVRLMDYQRALPEQSPGSIQNMITLSPGIGQALPSKNTQGLPEYTLDGNMAIQGLLHRALNSQIMADNFEGAMSVFRALQERTDNDRRQSLASFLALRSTSPLFGKAPEGMFTSAFPGIDYPAFDMRIPPVILGRLLDLATSAKAYEFGNWLLYSQDVDGPVIGSQLYKDPAIQPAVLRFALETDNRSLMKHFKGGSVFVDTLRSLFDSQVKFGRWDAAERVLKHMKDLPYGTWSVANLANLSKAMMRSPSTLHLDKANSSHSLRKTEAIFSDMVLGKYDGFRPKTRQHSIQTLLWVLSTIHSEWAQFCGGLQQHRGPIDFVLGTTAFNSLLQGVAEAYGSVNAQRLLEVVWPESARKILRSLGTIPNEDGRMKMPRRRLDMFRKLQHHRIVLHLPNASGQDSEAVLMGALDALPSTILVVFRKALQEMQLGSNQSIDEGPETPPQDTIAWTLHRFTEIQLRDSAVLREIDLALSDQRLLHFKVQFPILFGRSEMLSDAGVESSQVQVVHDERALGEYNV